MMLELDGAIAVADGGTSWTRDTQHRDRRSVEIPRILTQLDHSVEKLVSGGVLGNHDQHNNNNNNLGGDESAKRHHSLGSSIR
jgi:hypothetical protein